NAGFGFWQTAVGSRAALTAENYEKASNLLLAPAATLSAPRHQTRENRGS
ncbi:Mu-like prophage major head subunit gpT family protein, partial [Escherichia coli]